MLISQAYAAAPETADMAATSGLGAQLIPLALIFVVFYFLLIRPQQKKIKQHVDMVAALRRGDKIVTSGGIIGSISRIEGDKEVLVEIANGVEVRIVRSTIADVISKTPVEGTGAKAA